jgi:hypothetical protein
MCLSTNKLQTRKFGQPTTIVPVCDLSKNSPIKPMRPLTAYHIFFQIEREYIIQTTSGADDDASIHSNKSYQPNVPLRYSNIKLSNNWFAGPGKRAKRKHRKSHGKIGFLELSRVVSQRWANLGEIDPETKAFVTGIAKRELDQYKREMKEYEMLVKSTSEGKVETVAPVSNAPKTTVKKSSTKRTAKRAVNALPALPELVSAFKYENLSTLITPPATPPPFELFVSSGFDINAAFVDGFPSAISSTSTETSEDMSFPDDHIDYSISFMDNAGRHNPSPAGSVCEERKRSFSEDSVCDPLFELEVPSEGLYELSPKRRRLSTGDAFREFFDIWA